MGDAAAIRASVADVDTEWLTAPMAEPWVRLTHRPTGTTAEGRGENAHGVAMGELITKLVASGDITINTARAAVGLPPAPQPDPLTKDEVRQLLRECVTVVKPGEALVVRMAGLTPNQHREYQQAVTSWHQEGDLPFPVFIFIGDELGTAPASDPRYLP